jgi:uncharacterized protein (DUF2147 family)
MAFTNLLAVLPLAALLTAGSALAATPDAILGTWSPDNGHDSRIEITKCGNLYCGTVVWMRLPRNDDKNANPTLRNRPVVSTRIMTGARFEGKEAWGGGKLYNADTGRTGEAKFILLNKNEIEVHETMGEKTRTIIWKRVVM